MSAALRDRAANDDGEPLRPTREIPLRPTREPRAPFVAGPAGPRVAPAPRVFAARELDSSNPVTHRPPPVLAIGAGHATNGAQLRSESCVVVSFRRERAAAAIAALRYRGITVTALRAAAPGAGGMARELGRALRRATATATALGVIGALIGALVVSNEALVPSIGWLPGPAVGAALFAGVLGAAGFALGLLAVLVLPARELSPLASPRDLTVLLRSPSPEDSPESLIAAAIAVGGSAVAHPM